MKELDVGAETETLQLGKKVGWRNSQTFTKVKKFLGHFGLFMALILYTAAGAWVIT